MKITLDFTTYKRPENSLDFERAEQFVAANKRVVFARLRQLAKRAFAMQVLEESAICVNNTGSMAHNIPIKTIWLVLTKLSEEEVSYSVLQITYLQDHLNASPGPGMCGPVREKIKIP